MELWVENGGVATLVERRLFSMDVPTAGFFNKELVRPGDEVVITGVALIVTGGFSLDLVVVV